MYKIAHISDTHISYDDKNKNGEKLVELLKDINNRNCDHIVITGDLVDNPGLKDYQYFKEIFSHFELLDKNKLSIIPGNHDIFGGAPFGKAFYTFPTICKDIDYVENLDNFNYAFMETFPEDINYPYLKILGNTAIIGVNSVDIWSLKKNVEGSNGKVSKKDLNSLKKILTSDELKDKYKLVLMHHYFNDLNDDEGYPLHNLWLQSIDWKMKLYGKKELVSLFKKYKVNLVLHGHSHINQIYNLKGVTYINSSAAIAPITDDQIRKYNIISIPYEKNEKKKRKKAISVETISLD